MAPAECCATRYDPWYDSNLKQSRTKYIPSTSTYKNEMCNAFLCLCVFGCVKSSQQDGLLCSANMQNFSEKHTRKRNAVFLAQETQLCVDGRCTNPQVVWENGTLQQENFVGNRTTQIKGGTTPKAWETEEWDMAVGILSLLGESPNRRTKKLSYHRYFQRHKTDCLTLLTHFIQVSRKHIYQNSPLFALYFSRPHYLHLPLVSDSCFYGQPVPL